MAKLFKLQLKENLKTLIWIWLLPLVLSAGFIALNRILENNLLSFVTGLSIISLILGLGACGIIIFYNDYQRFYGKEAIFYQSLPISSGSVITSRFLTYLVSIIMIVLFLIIDFIILIMAAGKLEFVDFKRLVEIFEIITHHYSFGMFITILVLILSSLVLTINMIIFSINLGSQKSIKSMGIFGPVLAYIFTKILVQIVILLILYFLPYGISDYLHQLSRLQPQNFVEFLIQYRVLFYVVILINILISLLFAYISKYLQDKKLSVG